LLQIDFNPAQSADIPKVCWHIIAFVFFVIFFSTLRTVRFSEFESISANIGVPPAALIAFGTTEHVYP